MKNVIKYIERICKTDEERASEDNKFLNEDNKIKGMKEILDIERNVSQILRDLEDSKGSKKYSHSHVYELECKLALTKKRLASYRRNQKELF
jgi:hypothetical protein